MLEKINLLIKELLLDLDKLRSKPIRTIRQKNNYEKKLTEIVDTFTEKYLEILLPELQTEYLKSLNKIIRGVKTSQKKKFKKSNVPKTLNTEDVERRFREKMSSLKFLMMEHKKRELAAERLFSYVD